MAYPFHASRVRFPALPEGFTLGSFALRRLGRMDEAEAVLEAGLPQHDAAEAFLAERARLAMQRHDWMAALRRASVMTERFPGNSVGWQVTQFSLRQTGRLIEAEALLREVHDRFDGEEWLLIDFARVAQQRRDWAEAERRWAAYRAAYPDALPGLVEGALVARQTGQLALAEGLLQRAKELRPDSDDLAMEHARLAEQRRDWPEADRRWTQARTRFPQSLPVALGHALLPSHQDRQPPDLDQALSRLEAVQSTFPDAVAIDLERLALLRQAKRLHAAAAAAASAMARHSDNPAVAVAHAQAVMDLGDSAEALERWSEVTRRFPQEVTGFLRLATCLVKEGRPKEAEAVYVSAMAAFPDRSESFRAYAELAVRRHDWPAALQRWTVAATRFPVDQGIRTRLFEARLALTESAEKLEVSEAAVPYPTDAAASVSLLSHFESLGGTGQGCEFGLVQRALGCEPLGLLRWSTMRFEGLLDGLQSRFEKVGDPEQTALEVYTYKTGEAEYVTSDRRFGMRMHTFVPAHAMDFDKMYAQSCRRLTFLRGKLLQELSSGEKIFVFKLSDRTLSRQELDRLYAALQKYGDGTLLYVCYASATHKTGSVEFVHRGLLIGYINAFSMGLNGEALKLDVGSWLEICREARRLVPPVKAAAIV